MCVILPRDVARFRNWPVWFRADDFDVTGAGVRNQNLRHDIRRLEKNAPREIRLPGAVALINVGAGGFPHPASIAPEFPRRKCDVPGVAVIQVNARIWQAHVVNHVCRSSFAESLVID